MWPPCFLVIVTTWLPTIYVQQQEGHGWPPCLACGPLAWHVAVDLKPIWGLSPDEGPSEPLCQMHWPGTEGRVAIGLRVYVGQWLPDSVEMTEKAL